MDMQPLLFFLPLLVFGRSNFLENTALWRYLPAAGWPLSTIFRSPSESSIVWENSQTNIELLSIATLLLQWYDRHEVIALGIKVSVHGGSKLSQQHNRRQRNRTAKDGHVHYELTANNITFVDNDLAAVYEDIFGAAVREKDAREKNVDRRLGDGRGYLKKINEDGNGKHPAYEYIYQVGSKEFPPDSAAAKQILTEIWTEWQQRNPNLAVIGAYLHVDEEIPHLHIDYIPTAVCGRGMRLQNSLNKAFEQLMQTKSSARGETAQMMWQDREREYVRSVSKKYGIETDEIEHNTGVEHLDTADFKAAKVLAAAQDQAAALEKAFKSLETKKSKLPKANPDVHAINSRRWTDGSLEVKDGGFFGKKHVEVDWEVWKKEIEPVLSSTALINDTHARAERALKVAEKAIEKLSKPAATTSQLIRSKDDELAALRNELRNQLYENEKIADGLHKATEKLELLKGKLAGKYPAAYKELVLGEQVSSRGAERAR